MELDWNTTGFFNVSEQNASDVPITTRRSGGSSIPQWYESGKIQIPLYAVIFMLAVVGNTLVILTLVSKKIGEGAYSGILLSVGLIQ